PARPTSVSVAPVRRLPRVVGAPFRDPPPPRRRGDALGQLARRLTPADRRLLDAIGPRPYRPDAQLAAELGWCLRWARVRRNHLLRLGLVGMLHRAPGREDPPLPLPEHTQEGLAIAAAQHGLTPAQAVRFGGYVARPPGTTQAHTATPRGRVRAQLLGPL